MGNAQSCDERIEVLERQVKLLFGLLIDNMEDVNNMSRSTEIELENLSAEQLTTNADIRLLHHFKPLAEEPEPAPASTARISLESL
jgi:hypothetical protein